MQGCLPRKRTRHTNGAITHQIESNTHLKRPRSAALNVRIPHALNVCDKGSKPTGTDGMGGTNTPPRGSYQHAHAPAIFLQAKAVQRIRTLYKRLTAA